MADDNKTMLIAQAPVTKGEIGSIPEYGFQPAPVEPMTTSGVGPCDVMIDPTERRIALGAVYQTIMYFWRLNAAGTIATLDTTERKVGTVGLTDAAGASTQQDLGLNFAPDEQICSLASQGFFYSDYDFLFHSLGVQQMGPLFLGILNSNAANSYLNTASLYASTLTSTPDLQQTLFKALITSLGVTFSVDSETKCDWIGYPCDMAMSGFGLDNNDGGSNGVSVQGNRFDMRVNFRARGGSSNGRDTSKRLITKFTRGSGTAPSFTIPAGALPALSAAEAAALALGNLSIAQALRVTYLGCPTAPLQRASSGNKGSALASLSPAQISALSPDAIARLANM
jgi:hypothetical protein